MSRKPDRKQPTVTMRCAIYTRKSTEEGLDQEFNSLDAQREAGEAFITSQQHEGWGCLPDCCDDGGFTGGNMDRPALRRLMADIDAGKVDCVVVYKVDRLSRSLSDFARIMEVFDRHKVAFVSVTQQFNTATSNVVAWPEQMYLIPAWAEMFRSHGLRFHVDPYSSIAYYPYEYSEAERRFLEPWIWENRRAGLDSVKPDVPIKVLCSGGVDHINVQPDGSAWRCILERQLGVNPMGNVFNPGFRLFEGPLLCGESWQCPACDRDKVTIVVD